MKTGQGQTARMDRTGFPPKKNPDERGGAMIPVRVPKQEDGCDEVG